MPMLKRYGFVAALFWLLGAIPAVHAADLIFTAPPREQADAQGEDMYTPIAEFLSKVLQKKVTYVYPDNWLNYQKEMRDDKYDIVFDGPHFIAWRIEKIQHEVLARLPGPLDFVLVTNANETKLNSIEDLVAERFCGIAPPNLSTLVVLDKFRNPVRQPVVKSIRGGIPDVYKAFKQGQCKAATLRKIFYDKKLTDDDRKQLRVLFTSAQLPNQGFSVSRRINAKDRDALRAALTSDEGAKALERMIKQFGKAGDKLIFTDNKEYEGYHTLLEGVIFGW